jgi:hypothetical protein
MKTKISSFLLIILGFFLTFPVSAENENRDVPSFSEIALSIPGKLYLKQGNSQSVKIEAQSSTLEKIITEVKGDKLVIRFETQNYFRNSFKPGKIEIYITVPEIEGLSVSGSGNIIADDEINTDEINLAISGSGGITLEELKSGRVKAAVSGSGNIVINGSGIADEFEASISGSGHVNAKGFEARDASVKIAGSGNCSVTSNGDLNAKIAGSGSIYYDGNPKNVDSSVSGSGRVKKM